MSNAVTRKLEQGRTGRGTCGGGEQQMLVDCIGISVHNPEHECEMIDYLLIVK